MRKRLISIALLLSMAVVAAAATVTDVTAKQRYPWNGLVDITCKVSGINGTASGLKFAVAAVMPDSGEAYDVSQFWVASGGENSADVDVRTNGNYRLVWDAQADLGGVRYTNMVVLVTLRKDNPKVQLWDGGPYWATTNIGAEEPWEYGYYFWWGDTVGYKRENNAWVATDGSSSYYSFNSGNTPTYNKSQSALLSEGWVVSKGDTYVHAPGDDAAHVLAPEHDAAHIHWGEGWRMPTYQELGDLNSKCSWTMTTTNGVNGYIVRGRGVYNSNSIFLPCAGYGGGISLSRAGKSGRYWSSVPDLDDNYSMNLYFDSSPLNTMSSGRRDDGHPVRPVQGFTQ